MKPTLDYLRPCLEGAVPSIIATCDLQGVPNASYVSQVHYVDPEHAALSFQFFNKTHSNMRQNPQITAYLVDPETAARYRLAMLYLRTETGGALFENMRAKLAGIASHTGMSDVFALKGADICRVLDIETLPGPTLPRQSDDLDWPALLRQLCGRVEAGYDLAGTLESVLDALVELAGIEHVMFLAADTGARKLFTVASRGYTDSGIGSELPFGCGVIGVAAQHRTPIRINHMASDYLYGTAINRAGNEADQLETRIPFPGLAAPQSQLAVPLLAEGRMLGVLFLESAREMRFGHRHEDAFMVLCYQLAGRMCRLQRDEGDPGPAADTASAPDADLPPLCVRYFPENCSVFIDDTYLIKGVAGAILWHLLHRVLEEGRADFSNRELRLDPALRLPDIDDNLEARLILLRRRLEEKCPALEMRRTGRGRFRLHLHRAVTLAD